MRVATTAVVRTRPGSCSVFFFAALGGGKLGPRHSTRSTSKEDMERNFARKLEDSNAKILEKQARPFWLVKVR